MNIDLEIKEIWKEANFCSLKCFRFELELIGRSCNEHGCHHKHLER